MATTTTTTTPSIPLSTHLQTILPPNTRPSLTDSVLPKLLQSLASISQSLRTASQVSQIGTSNAFGDAQLNVDVLAENHIRAAVAQIPSIVTASSEEDPVERPTSAESVPEGSERYTVAFDPLDGSSIIAPNWSVGAIIGIWDGASALRQHPRRQVAAILGVFGPRTTAVVAVRVPGCKDVCFEAAVGEPLSDIWVVKPEVRLLPLPFKTRYFAPANLRAAADLPAYGSLISNFIAQKYTLRYSGGLVPDVVHALVKGHGVYVSPVSAQSTAKLRRLYELAPVALVVECAGGAAIDPADGTSVLEREIKDEDERGGLVCGTREEVESVKEALVGASS